MVTGSWRWLASAVAGCLDLLPGLLFLQQLLERKCQSPN
jgi:hypothetical protein